jgi:molybdopterin-containing oxidoreductase family membrane subunit
MAHTPEASMEKPAILSEVKPAVLPRPALVGNNRGFAWITDKVCSIVEEPTPRWWWVLFGVAGFVASFTVIGLIYLVSTGTGVWGLANPANWGWAIVNFVFWIGIGHAGTLISAILCLLRQKWRTSINRAAEAMTIFAVVCAGIFPVFHVGIPSPRHGTNPSLKSIAGHHSPWHKGRSGQTSAA